MRSVAVAALLLGVVATLFTTPTIASAQGEFFQNKVLFTAFVHGNQSEFQSNFETHLHLNSSRVTVTSFDTYMGPFGLHMSTAKFYLNGEGVHCDHNATLAPSDNRSWLDPCVTKSEFDMSLIGWQELEVLLLRMDPMHQWHMLGISEIWGNFTNSSVAPSTTMWKWRLHADGIGMSVEQPRVGRVELQAGEGAMWGTVCFEAIPFELAVAICNNMFPGTTSAKSYRAGGGRGFIAAHNLHHHHGIVNASLSSRTQKDNLCLHRNDLGLVCGGNVTQAPHHVVNQLEPAMFHITHGGFIDWKIEGATVGAIPPGSIMKLHHHHHNEGMPFSNHTVFNGSGYHFDSNLTFMLLGDAGQTSRDLDWILQHTNPWVLNETNITHMSSTIFVEPRFFPDPSYDIGKASFEVALHVFEFQLWHELERVLVGDSVRFVHCINDTHVLSSTGATVKTCWVEFTNTVEAAKAVNAANLALIHDVYEATDRSPTSDSGAPGNAGSAPSSGGANGGTIAAIVISVLVVVGVVGVLVVLHYRRTARANSAATTHQDFDANLVSSEQLQES